MPSTLCTCASSLLRLERNLDRSGADVDEEEGEEDEEEEAGGGADGAE